MRNAIFQSPDGLKETVSRSIVIKGDPGGHREGAQLGGESFCHLRVHVTMSRRMLAEGVRVFQTSLVRAQRERGIALGTGRKAASPHGGGNMADLGSSLEVASMGASGESHAASMVWSSLLPP